jgi:hypothetical protein
MTSYSPASMVRRYAVGQRTTRLAAKQELPWDFANDVRQMPLSWNSKRAPLTLPQLPRKPPPPIKRQRSG